LTVFYDPSLIFSGTNFDAQQIYIQTGGQPGYLFNNTPITAIAVDGANRKWVATGKGVFLVSADGTQIIQQFNATNSPLISNNVNSIAVNGETGEVFFATDKGMMSYRSTAEEANVVNTTLYAFPNPVRPGYTGVIAIHGLPIDGDVKITDVNGNLAYETTALGSQAIWDGKNFSGRPVNSGVYLVFCTSPDGTQTVSTKIVIVR
jgi:ligand-binding sensor domain-containing protein